MTIHEPGTVYKLSGTESPGTLLGLMLKNAAPSINRGKMSCRVRISRESPDRSRDVVRAKGAMLDNHRKNPVVCIAHNRTVVCGQAEDRMDNYTVKMAPNGELGWDAETFFDQHSEIGEQSFRLVETKAFRGASIGFFPIEGYVGDSGYGGSEYRRWELVEYSHLPIPDHPDCLVEAVNKGFGGKPLCQPLMEILKGLIPESPVIVTSGYEAVEPVEKAGTHKMAAPKEATARSRASVFYTCPHCNQEFTQEHVYKDEEANCHRHGACRGAVILKPQPHVLEAGNDQPVGLMPMSGKSLRFLPGLRRKAMRRHGEHDDVDNEDYSDFAPPDERDGDPPGDNPDGYDDEDDGAGMKPGNELFHRIHDCLMQALQEIDEGIGSVDNAHATKTAEKVASQLMRAVKQLTAGHSKYLEEHTDQEPLPGVDYSGSEPDEEDDGDEEDDETADLEADDEDDGEDEDGKPKKKKKGKPFGDAEEKAARGERMVLCNRYWEALKVKGVSADTPTLQAARDDLYAIAADKRLPRPVRVKANERRKALEAAMVTKQAKPSKPAEENLSALFDGFTMEDLDRACAAPVPSSTS